MSIDTSRIGFIASATSLVAVFAAAASPIPIYGLYRRFDGLTYGDFALTAAAYFAGAVTALLVLGRLSNHLGRRPLSLLSLGLAAAGCLILLHVSGVAPLLLARVLQGLACGLASSAVAAYIVDTAPSSPRWLAAAVASGAPMVGLSLGALGSGALAQYGPWPRTTPYLIVIAGLANCAAMVAVSRETVKRAPGALASLRPQLALPKSARRLFPVASCTFIATWALGGFYQAFAPIMAADQLGTTNTLVAAAVFASIMGPSAIGGPLAGRVSPAGAQRIGMVVFFLSVAGIVASLKLAAVIPFLVASAFAGAAQGATLTGSIRALLAGTAPSERAGLFSLIYATSYSGAAVPGLIAGQLSNSLTLFQITIGYGVLAAVACVATLVAASDPLPARTEARPAG